MLKFALPLLLLALAVSCLATTEPLFLSQYLSNPAMGRNLSAIVGLPYPAASHSGYFTIGTGRNTFFWYFENQQRNPNAPTLLWLQGGPGASSLFGLFSEMGPFSVAADGKTLVPRAITWTTHYNMIFVDNPVGVGFSFTTRADGFVANETQVGTDLYSFTSQFFTIFADIAANPLYITGESYGGKYAPSAACTLLSQIQSGRSALKLAGVTIGDGAIDPRAQFTGFSDLLYFLSMADQNERAVIRSYESRIRSAIDAGQWADAFGVFDELLNGDFYPYPTYFRNITGLTDYFNFLSAPAAPNPYPAYLALPAVHDMLHVGTGATYWDYNATVERNLIGDWMKPVTACVASLLNNGVPVLVYNGQNDVILGPALTSDALASLVWRGQGAFRAAKKIVWTNPADATDVRGYARQFKNLQHVIVRDAGHMVPGDQPARAYDMIQRFISGTSFGRTAQ